MCNFFAGSDLEFRASILPTVGELMDLTNRSVWSTTTPFTSSVGGANVNPPSCKTGTFFLRYFTISVPIYRNFQVSNFGWKKLCNILFYKKICFDV